MDRSSSRSGGPASVATMRQLLDDVEGGAAESVAFVPYLAGRHPTGSEPAPPETRRHAAFVPAYFENNPWGE